MSSYVSKSQKAFKPKAPTRRHLAPTPTSTSSENASVRGSVEGQTQTSHPQLQQALHMHRTSAIAEQGVSTLTTESGFLQSLAEPSNNVEHTPNEHTLSERVAASSVHQPKSLVDIHPSVISNPQNPASLEHFADDNFERLSSQNPDTQNETETHNLVHTRSNSSQNGDSIGPTGNGYEKAVIEISQSSASNATYRHDNSVSSSNQSNALSSVSSRVETTFTPTGRVTKSKGNSSSQCKAASYSPSKRSTKTPSGGLAVPAKSRTRKRRLEEHKNNNEPQGNGEVSEGQRIDSVSKQKAKRRKREPTPAEAETTEITPNIVTMSDLTKDSHLGRKSSRYLRLQEKDKEDVKRKQDRVRQEFQEFLDNPEGGAIGLPDEAGCTATSSLSAQPLSPEIEQPVVRLAPQVRVVNGQIVQDEDSRMINRHTAADQERDHEEVHVEDELTRRTTQATFMKRERKLKWTSEQTELFFDGLRMFGTDFLTISKMFPGRSRRQIKLKFTREERQDKEYIKQILLYEKKEPDIDKFQELSGIVYRDPSELEREIEEERRQLEEKQRKENDDREEAQRQRDRDVAAETLESGSELSNEQGDQGDAIEANCLVQPMTELETRGRQKLHESDTNMGMHLDQKLKNSPKVKQFEKSNGQAI